jgi:hypothetical protein
MPRIWGWEGVARRGSRESHRILTLGPSEPGCCYARLVVPDSATKPKVQPKEQLVRRGKEVKTTVRWPITQKAYSTPAFPPACVVRALNTNGCLSLFKHGYCTKLKLGLLALLPGQLRYGDRAEHGCGVAVCAECNLNSGRWACWDRSGGLMWYVYAMLRW